MSSPYPVSLYHIFIHHDIMPCCGKACSYIIFERDSDSQKLKCDHCNSKFYLFFTLRTMFKL